MKINEVILISVLLGVLVGLASIYAYPSTTSYSVANRGSNGFSDLLSSFRASIVTDLNVLHGVNASNTTYLLIRSSKASASELGVLNLFLASGGNLIVSGTPNFINSVAEYFNLGVRVEEAVVYDMVRNSGDRFHPIGFSDYCNASVTTYLPHYITGEGFKVLAHSSDFSYADLDGDGYIDLDEPMGRFPIAASISVGSGQLILVSSPEVFTNELIDSNREFVGCVIGGRSLLVDQVSVKSDLIEYMRVLAISRGSPSYLFVTLAAILCLVVYYVFREG